MSLVYFLYEFFAICTLEILVLIYELIIEHPEGAHMYSSELRTHKEVPRSCLVGVALMSSLPLRENNSADTRH